MDRVPAPRGQELDAAGSLATWCRGRWPHLQWQVQQYSDMGANLVGSGAPGPLLYSHLDTSLEGVDGQEWITARDEPAGPLIVRGGVAQGVGVGVARGPAAAAIAAFAETGCGTLLLAGSGTHRAHGRADGAAEFLKRTRAVPRAAVIAKCGPAGLLWEEPGAAYLRVRVEGSFGAALAPSSATPHGGLAAHLGTLLEVIGTWRERYVTSRHPVGQVGPEAGVGAVRCGSADKPDLLPGRVQIDLYVVTVPGERPSVLRDDFEVWLRAGLAGTPLQDCSLHVGVDWIHDAAATAPQARIVQAGRRAWASVFGGSPPAVTRWTGSTDGVVFRAAGIDTVRVGPRSTPSPADPRRDSIDLGELERFSRLYAILLRDR